MIQEIKAKIVEVTGLTPSELHGYGSMIIMTISSLGFYQYFSSGLAVIYGAILTLGIDSIVEFIDYKSDGQIDKDDLKSDIIGTIFGMIGFGILLLIYALGKWL